MGVHPLERLVLFKRRGELAGIPHQLEIAFAGAGRYVRAVSAGGARDRRSEWADGLPVRQRTGISKDADDPRSDAGDATRAEISARQGRRILTCAAPQAPEGQEHEGFFRSIIDAALDAVIVMDARGLIVHWNQQAEATFGWSREEAVGRLLASLIIPFKHRQAHARGLERFLATGERSFLGRRIELTALRRDGSEFPVELTVSPFLQAGEVAFTGFVRDITERRRAEAQQARQAVEAEMLYQATRLAAESASFDAALQSCLDLICRMTGWPVGHVYVPAETGDELVSTKIWHIENAEAYAAFRAVTDSMRFRRGVGLPGRVWQTGEPQWFENVPDHEAFVRRQQLPQMVIQTAFAFPVTAAGETLAILEFVTGAVVPLDARLMMLVRSMGEQVGRLIERRRAEEAIRRSERRFRDFAASASDWLWETDAEHRFVWLSPNVEARVSVPPEWHYGKTRLELMKPGTDPAVVEAHRRVLEAHQPFREFEYLRRGPAEDTWLSVSGLPLFDSRGRFQGYRGVSCDVTEKKRAEAHREMLLAELHHRVRNSLAVVQAIANCTSANSTSLQEFLARFSGRIGALATAHDLLTQADWGHISLRELVIKTLKPYRSDEPVRIHVEVHDVVLGPAVAQTLSLALHELAVNATKHGALSVGAGEVWLTARAVADDGREVDLHWREAGGPPARPPERTGFGLTVIQNAIQDQHEGRVDFEWRAEGLTCRMHLPLATSPGKE